jgi:hypothetical protein
MGQVNCGAEAAASGPDKVSPACVSCDVYQGADMAHGSSQRLQVLLPQPGVLPCLRLCMVLATIAAYNCGEQAALFISQALQLASDSAQAGQVLATHR